MEVSANRAARRIGDKSAVALAGSISVLLGMLISIDPRAAVAILLVLIFATTLSYASRLPAAQVYVGSLLLVSAAPGLFARLFPDPTISGFGLLTLGYGLLSLVYLSLRIRRIESHLPSAAIVFFVWAIVITLISGVSKMGIQNLVVFLVFGTTLVASADAVRSDGAARLRLDDVFEFAAWLGLLYYGVALVIGGLASNTFSTSPRGFALWALMILAWSVPRFGDRPRARLLALISLALVLASLSRGALLIALILLILPRTSPRSIASLVKLAVGVALAAGVLYVGIAGVPALHDRFYTGDIQRVGGINVSTSGRQSVWRAVWNSYEYSPIVGQGAGSADNQTASIFGKGAGSPHNDYLRILHDFGALGLALFVAAVIQIVRRSAFSIARGEPHRGFLVHSAALGLTGFALAMSYDNPIIYLFIVVPLAFLIGVSSVPSDVSIPRNGIQSIKAPAVREGHS